MPKAPSQNKPLKKTTPRTKGCYNCSQRRISCDRNEPACHKCIAKGLECSGLGLRVRFRQGLTSSGQPVCKRNESKPFKARKDGDFPALVHEVDDDSDSSTSIIAVNHSPSEHIWVSQNVLVHQPDHLNHQMRFLLDHFSTSVAPAMVIIDSLANGYRDFLLPLAENYQMVRDAAVCAASYHLAPSSQQMNIVGHHHRARVINSLKNIPAGMLDDGDGVVAVAATIVLLLVAEMVSASTDFEVIFKMLKFFIMSQGGEAKIARRPTGLWLVRQIRKIQLYGEPLLSEEGGSSAMLARSQRTYDCYISCLQLDPSIYPSVAAVVSLIDQACQIYLSRASRDVTSAERDAAIEHFIETASKPEISAIGGHILIWAHFIAAAESVLPHHREFLRNKLLETYETIKFSNIPFALNRLDMIWEKVDAGGPRWTKMLTQFENRAFIM